MSGSTFENQVSTSRRSWSWPSAQDTANGAVLAGACANALVSLFRKEPEKSLSRSLLETLPLVFIILVAACWGMAATLKDSPWVFGVAASLIAALVWLSFKLFIFLHGEERSEAADKAAQRRATEELFRESERNTETLKKRLQSL